MARRIRAAYYRGGTSRAIIFRRADLPEADPSAATGAWDSIFTAALGSPDPSARQLDGMGGGISSLSKIAVVAPSARPDADVDYTFAQVGIDPATVSYRGNCGNISSAVGPFALEEGMVTAPDGPAEIRIFNTNTSKLLLARFAVEGGLARVAGDFAIDGVAGRHAPIELSFLQPTGSVTGRMFPTGRLTDTLVTASGRELDVTMIDVANPLVIAGLGDLLSAGTGFDYRQCETAAIVALAEEIRIAAAVAMGIAADAGEARTKVTNLPLVALVRPPCAYTARSGAPIWTGDANIVTQMYSAGMPHKATPVTGAMALAAATRVPGTVASAAAAFDAGASDAVLVGHPSGTLKVSARCALRDGTWEADETGVFRTARRLFEGNVVLP